MPFDEELAERVRHVFRQRCVAVEEKRMFGGLCFKVQGKMCLGILDERLMARIDPDVYETALERCGCSAMDFTGRPMRGYVFVHPEGLKTARDLDGWIDLALEINPRATSSKRKIAAKTKKSGITRRKKKP